MQSGSVMRNFSLEYSVVPEISVKEKTGKLDYVFVNVSTMEFL